MGRSAHIAVLVLVHICISSVFALEGNSSAAKWTHMKNCRRTCDGETKICYLKLHVERYTVLGPACRECENGVQEDCLLPQCVTADGFKRSVITLNRMIPSPPIDVCRNDKLVVDVVNQMEDETTSIHWHGFRQFGTQYYDGAPHVTQCPIDPGTTFRYRLNADEAGSFFYHSHTGLQKLDGVAGPLIVRDVKENDKQAKYYDEDLPEHCVFITDWTHVPAEHLIPGLHSDEIRQIPVTAFIGGRGKYYDDAISNIVLPIKEFVVESGKRYRFRLVSSTCMTCGLSVKFDYHTLTVLSADGGLTFQPVEVQTILMNPADRFDVVLNAIQPPGGVYTITVQGVGPRCQNISQHATLRYKNTRPTNKLRLPSPSKNNLVFNDLTSNCESPSDLCISHLNGTYDAPKITNLKMYQQILISFGIYRASIEEIFKKGFYISYEEPVKGTLTIPFIDNIAFNPPPSPMISQLSDIPKEYYCSDECRQRNMSLCSCTNVYEIKKYSIVDLILYDKDAIFPHPIHLHGYNFFVLEMGGKLPDIAALKKRLRNNEISLKKRPQRDTISVPTGGYAVVRFVANNPGPWFLHCHFAFHQHGGMAVVLLVGEPEDLPPVPKNFPKCGNFVY